MEDQTETVDVNGSGERKSPATLEEPQGGGGEGAHDAARNSPAHNASRSASPIIDCVSSLHVEEREACSVGMAVVAMSMFTLI